MDRLVQGRDADGWLSMTERNISAERLLNLLPDQAEFDSIRAAILRLSVPDRAMRWSEGAAYATLQMRVVPAAQVGALLQDAENALRRRVKRLYDGVAIGISALADGRVEEKALQLILSAEVAEGGDQWRDAIAFYSMAVKLLEESADSALRALASRRLARAHFQLGDYDRAASNYGAALALADGSADLEGVLSAATGLGNVASMRGRWPEATHWYEQALARADQASPHQKAQLYGNLSMTAREQRHFESASRWLDQAFALWPDLTRAEQCELFNNRGMLQSAMGEHDLAIATYNEAMALAAVHFHRAMILDNLAEAYAAQGKLELAEHQARLAEEEGLAMGSPRVLAEVYLRLGRIARLRQDPNGIVFFNKAFDLARAHGYPLLVGQTYYDLALFRKTQGDRVAAAALLQQAMMVFTELGATFLASRVRDELSAH